MPSMFSNGNREALVFVCSLCQGRTDDGQPHETTDRNEAIRHLFTAHRNRLNLTDKQIERILELHEGNKI